ncbi:Response regulator containing a CheY-like receiver domain and an HTH DNA-binding domain [Hahella chejuensis KCTC 2396]|uniref:Response regulator containing a CheY-like receiver domain and an HTH DNA-binding domain n=1 Tax=Hahella chejuensis (strain KCTC 2396) TaxID=349521 RepID=Q2SLH5_HAHCH|nr:response regulator transcription factor [Hahella chejuensis]ABC28499.1 Response regulator containing a CheY-like receiver domain and an HTH DNA-binding domain [Hahella chejuensis KCTC 2396]
MESTHCADVRALLVDDHPIVIDALSTSLLALKLCNWIDKANTLAEAKEKLANDADFSLVLLDLHLSDAEGIHAMMTMREAYPDIPIIIFSGDDSTDTIAKAFEYGVRGYVPKNSPVEVVVSAVKVVLAGSCYIPPHAIRMLGFEPAAGTVAIGNTAVETRPYFSPRQEQVFHYLLEGMPNKVIAARLDMAEGTVKTHMNTIFRALGVRNRAQAILKARQLGVI